MNTSGQVSSDETVYITHECGDFVSINSLNSKQYIELGWIQKYKLKKDLRNVSTSEFKQMYIQAASQAVTDIIKDWRANESACNLCVRAALYNLTGDEVLYPTSGSSLTIKDNGEPLYGKVSTSDGNAQGIIDDLKKSNLSAHFEEVIKGNSETYSAYWKRLQGLVDLNKEIVIGVSDPGHVFMVVPTGMHPVVDNTSREESKLNVTQTTVSLGDKWGGSFARRGYTHVLRIMDCGNGVKFSNGPMYGVMDAKPMIGKHKTKVARFYKYKK